MSKVLLCWTSRYTDYLFSERGVGAKGSGRNRGLPMRSVSICGSLMPSDQRRPNPLPVVFMTVSGVHPRNTGKFPMYPITWAPNGTLMLNIILDFSSTGFLEDMVAIRH